MDQSMLCDHHISQLKISKCLALRATHRTQRHHSCLGTHFLEMVNTFLSAFPLSITEYFEYIYTSVPSISVSIHIFWIIRAYTLSYSVLKN